MAPFNEHPKPPSDGGNLEMRPLFTDEYGSQYLGQWSKETNKPDGKGVMLHPDYYLYEGYFKNNKYNCRGRFISSYGHVYEGEWKDDKAHGKGVYTKNDGLRGKKAS